MKNKGITLIALVVTIIILLILAGVTIGFAMNGTSLFDKAKLATDKYNNSVDKEDFELEKAINGIENYVSGNRDIGISTDIDDFIPIINFNNGIMLEITSNAVEKSSVDIAGYAYLVNGKVKDVSKNAMVLVDGLNHNTKYTISVIAIDENGKMKKSSDLEVTTDSKFYILKDGIEYGEPVIGKYCTFNQNNASSSASISNNKLEMTNSCSSSVNWHRGIMKQIDFTKIHYNKIYIKIDSCNIVSGRADIGVGQYTSNSGGSYLALTKSKPMENASNVIYDIDVSDINSVVQWGISMNGSNSQSATISEIWFE